MTEPTKTPRTAKPLTIVAANIAAADDGQIGPATTTPSATAEPEPAKRCCQSDANSSLDDALMLRSGNG